MRQWEDNEKLQAWSIHVPLFNKESRKKSKIFPPCPLFYCLPNEWIRISMWKIYFFLFSTIRSTIYDWLEIIDRIEENYKHSQNIASNSALSIFTMNWNKSTTIISLYNSNTPHPRRNNCNLKWKAKHMCVSVLVY